MTWADIDKLKASIVKPAPLVGLHRPGWYCFAECLEPHVRFHSHRDDSRISIRQRSGYSQAWLHHGVAWPKERPALWVLALKIGPLLKVDIQRVPVHDFIPWNTWRAVLVALDSWREQGCLRMFPPTRVEWLP